MNCHSKQGHHHGGHGCGCGSSIHPELWSNKKKLSVLEHKLDCLDERKKDIEQLIQELKDEMK
mgnify:CR=1 FL=1